MENNNKVLFICGLHRSGTSILSDIVSNSENISSFKNTGVPENEGQHLQSVFKAAHAYGGPGKFAFDKNARLTERSALITNKNKDILFREWSNYWDLTKEVLLEKSPPNIIRTRFLQEIFPNAYFITIIRNPIVVSLSTQKWSRTSIESLLEHWIKAHEIYFNDRLLLTNSMLISYEELIKNPKKVLRNINDFAGVEIDYKNQLLNKNSEYLAKWNSNYLIKDDQEKLIKKYEEKINFFGYSLVDINRFPTMDNLNNK
ncbi:sulfotransferase family protein [Flavivirga spongiicola]|uniref:Sulfotransferase n=1 Tax=Flavivirga spongiicola TaxID=421621 RepID=A0ABU7XVJ8_9FLAO|nr:sulfotransferase [Flavivirga sp. MEBiC05379]MDO5979794.1 sulfotransferase [Flavivirga sp. MEBiC05379]